MKIAIFHEFVYPYVKGGGEVQRYEVAKKLAAFGHDVTLIGYNCPKTPKNEIVEGFRIKRIGILPVKKAEQHLSRLIDAISMLFSSSGEKYDIMMTNPFLSLMATLPTAKLRGKKVAVTWDDVFGYATFRRQKGLVLGMLAAVVEKLCLSLTRHSDMVFTVSNASKSKLVKAGISADKIVVMYNGLNIEEYAQSGIKKKKQIIYVGRHLFYKNVEHLIRAFAPLAKKVNHLQLVLLGQGEMTGRYKHLVKSLGIESSVEFRGFVSQKEKIRAIRESALLVLPSSYEGFGIVLAESNICGTPYVAYDIPAVREVTEITKGGILVEHGNVDALSKTMGILLRNPRKRSALAKAGRKNVSEKFTWTAVAKTVDNAITSL